MSNKKANNILETWGNESTMNLNAIIYQNILSSPYFRSLFNKKTFHEIVDEIYNEVYVLSPFVKGTQPSTAYCCLFKMWTLRLTVKQIENMIDHVDSPYIRAIGFLYLRYVCAPSKLWDWFQYYLEDEEEITISTGPKPTKITIGKLCHMLITEQKFQGTMLPRIPVPIARDLEKKLQEHDREKRYGGDRSEEKRHKENDSYSRDRSHSTSRSSRRSRSKSPGRRETRDELDDYERQSRRYDRREDNYRRRSISPDYHYSSRSRDRSPVSRSRDRSPVSRSRDRSPIQRSRENSHRSRSKSRDYRSRSRERSYHSNSRSYSRRD